MNYSVDIDDYSAQNVSSVSILLENLEQIVFYKGEILDINLEFDSVISFSTLGLRRVLNRGRIVVKIDETLDRPGVCLWNLNGEQIDMRDFKGAVEGRILGNSDITNITITESKFGRRETVIVPTREENGKVRELARTIKDKDGIRILLGEW